jgi:hypothetical protein
MSLVEASNDRYLQGRVMLASGVYVSSSPLDAVRRQRNAHTSVDRPLGSEGI